MQVSRILITGSNGLLGQKLISLLTSQDSLHIIATGKGEDKTPILPKNYQYFTLDITEEEEVFQQINALKPDAIIHTAAMTNVDACEMNPKLCNEINTKGVENIVNICKQEQIFLIHLSTDFIFDGVAGNYTEDALPNPISEYGKSKLAAEQIIQQNLTHYAIIRTALVYGWLPNISRTNIVLWVKESLENNRTIKVVNDQWRTPTLAEDLAMGCWLILQKKATGIFNISGKEVLTPYQMALQVADFFHLDATLIQEADASSFSQPAKRPPKTGFILTKAQQILHYQPTTFVEGLNMIAQQMKQIPSHL